MNEVFESRNSGKERLPEGTGKACPGHGIGGAMPSTTGAARFPYFTMATGKSGTVCGLATVGLCAPSVSSLTRSAR
jgi:hypothetical protein